MQAVSTRFKEKLYQNSSLAAYAMLYLADGTKRRIDGAEIKAMSYEQATSSDQSFDIGSAIVGKLSLTIANFEHGYDSYDFTNAEVVPYVGTIFEDGTEEYLCKGRYWVQQPDAYGDDVQLVCYDALSLLSAVKFSDIALSYPAGLYDVASACCAKAGMTITGSDDAYDCLTSHYVSEPTNADQISAIQAVSYVAQAAGLFVRATNEEHPSIRFDWYDVKAFEGEDWLDGGTYETETTPYSDGDTADGGTFYTTTTPYSDGYVADGGTFENNSDLDIVNQYSSITVGTDDAVVTGISVTEQNEVIVDPSGNETNGEDGHTFRSGTDGYVLSISGNPFIGYGTAKEYADSMGARIIGMRFRRFSCTCAPDPSFEPGDAIEIVDRLGRVYRSYVTRVALTVNGQMTVSCGCETPARNSAQSASATTQAVVAARNEVKREMTARELAEKRLSDKIGESSGLYQTVETLADGSKVYYMHDKPTVAASKIIWKMTSGAIAVSTDGGENWSAGLTAEGDLLAKRVQAIELSADQIKTGVIKSMNSFSRWSLSDGAFVNVDKYKNTAKINGGTFYIHPLANSNSHGGSLAPICVDGKYGVAILSDLKDTMGSNVGSYAVVAATEDQIEFIFQYYNKLSAGSYIIGTRTMGIDNDGFFYSDKQHNIVSEKDGVLYFTNIDKVHSSNPFANLPSDPETSFRYFDPTLNRCVKVVTEHGLIKKLDYSPSVTYAGADGYVSWYDKDGALHSIYVKHGIITKMQ